MAPCLEQLCLGVGLDWVKRALRVFLPRSTWINLLALNLLFFHRLLTLTWLIIKPFSFNSQRPRDAHVLPFLCTALSSETTWTHGVGFFFVQVRWNQIQQELIWLYYQVPSSVPNCKLFCILDIYFSQIRRSAAQKGGPVPCGQTSEFWQKIGLPTDER